MSESTLSGLLRKVRARFELARILWRLRRLKISGIFSKEPSPFASPFAATPGSLGTVASMMPSGNSPWAPPGSCSMNPFAFGHPSSIVATLMRIMGGDSPFEHPVIPAVEALLAALGAPIRRPAPDVPLCVDLGRDEAADFVELQSKIIEAAIHDAQRRHNAGKFGLPSGNPCAPVSEASLSVLEQAALAAAGRSAEFSFEAVAVAARSCYMAEEAACKLLAKALALREEAGILSASAGPLKAEGPRGALRI